MNPTPLRILLADDDKDDCTFFVRALSEIPMATQLTVVNDGEQLMDYLAQKTPPLPHVIFLDLSMPRKTGFECLAEIKEDERWKNLHVVMLSTSYARDVIYEQGLMNTLTKMGSEQFIRKPSNYDQLKELIYEALKKLTEAKLSNP